jgi:hypothetical protein
MFYVVQIWDLKSTTAMATAKQRVYMNMHRQLIFRVVAVVHWSLHRVWHIFLFFLFQIMKLMLHYACVECCKHAAIENMYFDQIFSTFQYGVNS